MVADGRGFVRDNPIYPPLQQGINAGEIIDGPGVNGNSARVGGCDEARRQHRYPAVGKGNLSNVNAGLGAGEPA